MNCLLEEHHLLVALERRYINRLLIERIKLIFLYCQKKRVLKLDRFYSSYYIETLKQGWAQTELLKLNHINSFKILTGKLSIKLNPLQNRYSQHNKNKKSKSKNKEIKRKKVYNNKKTVIKLIINRSNIQLNSLKPEKKDFQQRILKRMMLPMT